MRIFTFLTIIFFTLQLYAQDVKGYYITCDGKKIEGYFKQGNFNDLSSLEFKQSKKEYMKMIPDLVKEYGVGEEFKFEKHLVQLDVSDSSNKAFQWSAETIFMNVIVQGNTTLYSYTKDYNTKYFIRTKDKQEPQQLMFKKFTAADGTVSENNSFRQQLYNNVRCKGQTSEDFLEVLYDKKQLADVVKGSNLCSGDDYVEYYNGMKKKSGFKYSILAGISELKLGINDAEPPVDKKQDAIKFSFATEVEYTYPSLIFSLFVGAEYELMSTEISDTYEQPFNFVESKYKLDANAINFYLGPRYNFVINDRDKIFIDVAPVFSFPFGDITKTSVITNDTGASYPGNQSTFELKPALYLKFGIGYIINEKYGIELRGETKRDFLNDVISPYKTDITRLGISFRYTLN